MSIAPEPVLKREEEVMWFCEGLEEAARIAENVLGSPFHATTSRQCAMRIRAVAERARQQSPSTGGGNG